MAIINLLTIHWGYSYGGIMQTYATVQTLRRLGHEVNLINLVHPKTQFIKRYKNYRSFLVLVKEFQFYLFKRIQIGRLTKKMMTIKDTYIPESDITIVGSDQVWNRDITTCLSNSYFLDFVKSGKKLAYASSFGKYNWDEDAEYTENVKEFLSSFSAISVREDSSVQICKDIFGVNAIRILDPTLALGDFGVFIKRKKPKHIVYPFILAPSQETNAICKTISAELRAPIYSGSIYQNIFKCSPIDWLNNINNSDFIITDSFHGLAFSILFHKQFVVLCADKAKFTRLQSLLQLLCLEERYISDYNDLKSKRDIIKSEIDYDKVDCILESERVKTLSFLKSNTL